MGIDIEQAVEKAEDRARKLQALLVYAPRPFVIEFAGTPKSGKSTAVEAIRHFFVRHGFRVHVLTERAALCPIPMKGHLFFNTWCAASMLAELLENVETETDIVIVDRGLFDALVWMTLQERRGELAAEEARTIEAFLLLDRWRTLIDLAVVMNVSAEEALDRETTQRITRKGGSIMNPQVLGAISDSVDEAVRRYGPRFAGIVHHKTTGRRVRESSVDIASSILGYLDEFLNPEILVVPRREFERLPMEGGGAFGKMAVENAYECIRAYGRFMRRAEAEVNAEYVQIVSCGVLSYNGQVFLFQRKETDTKYSLYGKTTIWQGCHVAKAGGVDAAELLRGALQDRVSRALFLSRVFPIDARGYCWDRQNPHSSRHFGVVYRVRIDNPHTAADLRKKEFRKRRGHGLIGEFDEIGDLIANQDELRLESWSRAILANLGVA